MTMMTIRTIMTMMTMIVSVKMIMTIKGWSRKNKATHIFELILHQNGSHWKAEHLTAYSLCEENMI